MKGPNTMYFTLRFNTKQLLTNMNETSTNSPTMMHPILVTNIFNSTVTTNITSMKSSTERSIVEASKKRSKLKVTLTLKVGSKVRVVHTKRLCNPMRL